LPEDPSNLHYHGLSVSPRANSDNVFRPCPSRQEFHYVIRLPTATAKDRDFFGITRMLGFVAKQMLGGMSGAIVIDGSEQYYPILVDMPRNSSPETCGDRRRQRDHIDQWTAKAGRADPAGRDAVLAYRNIGATLFMKFRMDGVQLYAIATDGHFLGRPSE